MGLTKLLVCFFRRLHCCRGILKSISCHKRLTSRSWASAWRSAEKSIALCSSLRWSGSVWPAPAKLYIYFLVVCTCCLLNYASFLPWRVIGAVSFLPLAIFFAFYTTWQAEFAVHFLDSVDSICECTIFVFTDIIWIWVKESWRLKPCLLFPKSVLLVLLELHSQRMEVRLSQARLVKDRNGRMQGRVRAIFCPGIESSMRYSDLYIGL